MHAHKAAGLHGHAHGTDAHARAGSYHACACAPAHMSSCPDRYSFLCTRAGTRQLPMYSGSRIY